MRANDLLPNNYFLQEISSSGATINAMPQRRSLQRTNGLRVEQVTHCNLLYAKSITRNKNCFPAYSKCYYDNLLKHPNARATGALPSMIPDPAPPPVPSLIQRANTQFLRFAAVGAAGTALHYLVLLLLVEMAGVAPGRAAFAGAVAGACVNYWLNRRFTFQSTRRHRETVPLFVAMAALGAVLNGLIVGQLSAMGMNFLLAQMFATVCILVLNFLMSKKWIFQKNK